MESKAYIDHRLRLVGSSSSDVFTLGAISMICRHAQGIPRVMNVLCDNAFLIGYGLARKRVDVDIIRQVIKEIDGLSLQQTTLSSISTAIRKLCLSPLRPSLFLNRASLAILSLLCVGVLILLGYGSLQRRPVTTRNIDDIKNRQKDIEHSSRLPSPLKVREEGSKNDARPHAGEPKPVSPELLQSVSRPADSRIRTIGGNKLKEVVAVGAGQTISSLAQKYFGMANSTFVDLILDFNPEITNVHLITVNQRIKIPIITEELLILGSFDRAYKIHAGTFFDPDIARAYRDEPALKGKEIEILPRKVSPQETWHRVVIGNFDSKEEALKVIDLLKGRGLLPISGVIQRSGELVGQNN